MYTECPTEPLHLPEVLNVFLAGGITGCPNWQQWFALRHDHINWVNPRRQNFDVDDERMGHEQIEWEHRNLAVADVVVFWFPEETLCPITLYELGVEMARQDKPLFVGTHVNYARRFDVLKQAELAGYDETIHDNIVDLLDAVIEWEEQTRF